jgi:hypothetical protein
MTLRQTSPGIVLVPLALALLALTVFGGEDTQARQTAPPISAPPAIEQAAPTRVLECFNLNVPRNQPGGDPKAVVRLVTQNFGGDLVRVRRLALMCELALKVPVPVPGTPDETPPPPDPAAVRVLACYEIERGTDPNDPFVLSTRNFGRDIVWVRTSKLMCEEASKTRVLATGQVVTVGQPTGQPWQCFILRNAKNNNLPFRLVTNNFGRDDVFVLRGVNLCEDAMKLRQDAAGTIITSGEATGRVMECFRVESKLDPRVRVTLTTRNFGPVEAEVRRAASMCEDAEKISIYTFPDDFDSPGGEED